MSNKKDNSMSYNFGVHGWGIVGYEIILLFFMTGLTVDGLNTIVPAMAELRGWDPNSILAFSTPAGIIALILTMFWGKFANAFGLKKVTVVTIFGAAIATALYGNSTSIPMYVGSLVAMVTLINAFAIICGMSITTNWFPTKKGLVMGLTTIGMNLASALVNWVLTFFRTLTGDIAGSLTCMAGVMAIVGVITIIFVHDTPEKAGCYPDNDPEVAKMLAEKVENTESTLTYIDALKNPLVWILGVGYGFFGLATVGIMSQLVGYFMAVRSMEFTQALSMMTIAAVIGCVGSWAWGVVDQKFGTQQASFLFGIWYLIGIIFLVMQPKFCMYIGLFMLGCAIGGNGNFSPSMAGYVFGRKDFAVSFSVMNTIIGVVRSCSFFALAITSTMFGGFTIPYIIFGVLACLGGLIIKVTKITGKID